MEKVILSGSYTHGSTYIYRTDDGNIKLDSSISNAEDPCFNDKEKYLACSIRRRFEKII